MRLPAKSSDEFVESLNAKAEKVTAVFIENIIKITKTIPVKVMLGDGTVSDQRTFDPQLVHNFYQKIIKGLPEWKTDGISVSNNEDLRRIFVKFSVREDNYLLNLHISLQYHAVLHYKLDNRVMKYQKELSEIMDKTKSKEAKIVQTGERLIMERLRNMGYKDVDEQKLFEIFFKNDELRDKLYNEVQDITDDNFQKLSKRKSALFKELDSLILETYQTSPTLIDETKLMAGEEGVVCNFDLEFFKKKTKAGEFNQKKIPQRIKEKLSQRFDELLQVIQC
ncbi:MAG: hypothetical protein ACE5JT_01135 [Nitrosopumilaceae archaeon]